MQKNLLKRLLAILFWLCLTYPPALAQTPKSDSITRYKWEIGTDLLWLIDKNTLPKTTVFGRYNYVTKKGKHRAIRLRLGLDFSKVDSSQIFNSTPTDINRFSPFIRLGYEWQKVNGKFCWFYGVDAHFAYYRWIYENERIASQDRIYSQLYNTSVGLVGFLGGKYFINSYFSVSGELNFQVNYNSYDRWGYAGTIGFPTGTESAENRYEWSTSFNPLYVLNFSYHF